jgi:hypothetical protein
MEENNPNFDVVEVLRHIDSALAHMRSAKNLSACLTEKQRIRKSGSNLESVLWGGSVSYEEIDVHPVDNASIELREFLSDLYSAYGQIMWEGDNPLLNQIEASSNG